MRNSDQSQPNSSVIPQAIEQEKPSFFVYAEADRPSLKYYAGEQLTITIRCEVDAYLYVLYTQSDQQSFVVLPNSGSSNEKVPAKQERQIPGKKDPFRWTVNAPFGKESLKVIASKQRIQALENPELRKQQATALSQDSLAKLMDEIKSKLSRQDWSEVSLQLTTHEGVNPESPYSGKRFGVFCAVPTQYNTTFVRSVSEQVPVTENLGASTLCDQLLMQRTLSQTGGLDAFRMLPDPNQPIQTLATREGMKQAITSWLPTVSNPGDTVIVYFSGHGAAMDDPTQPGGKQSFLVPCDYVDLFGLLALRKLRDDGKGSELHLGIQEQAERWLAGENLSLKFTWDEFWNAEPNQRLNLYKEALPVQNCLIQHSCVLETEFSHWLQSLPGRRIVVIFDACNSGGFAPQTGNPTTKGNTYQELRQFSPKPVDFQFLKQPLIRLKDLGQQNTALIAAAQADQASIGNRSKNADGGVIHPASVVWNDVHTELAGKKDLLDMKWVSPEIPAGIETVGVFTFYLSNSLLTSTEAVDIDQAGAAAADGMKRYFDSDSWQARNAERVKQGHPAIVPHQPVYFDHCRPKALIKP